MAVGTVVYSMILCGSCSSEDLESCNDGVVASNDAAKDSDLESIQSCDQECCVDSEISQPTNSALINKTEKSYGSGRGMCKRYFLVLWYKQFPWIHFCKSRMKSFCYYCKLSHGSNVV